MRSLDKHPSFPGVRGPVLFVVMDGVGVGPADEGNAVHLARTPTLDRLAREFPFTTVRAHGTAVGLPSDGDMGNSEVGHNALGAGRVFDQGAKRVQLAIESGELFEGGAWRELTDGVRTSGEALHFIGLLSDGNVHSHIAHLFAMIERAHADGVESLRVHPLLDGRDVPERSALEYVDQLEELLARMRDAGRDYRVGSGGGRMVTTMDRYEADWSIVERGYHAHVHGRSHNRFPSLRAAVEGLYESTGKVDQFLPEFVIVDDTGEPVGPIRDGAGVVFFNFRGDRAIEISRAFEDDEFSAFDRGARPKVMYAGMMEYDGDLHIPGRYLVEPPEIDATMGEYLAGAGVTQFACSETQKFGHVTYFWNGNKSGFFDEKLERYLEITSDRVPFEERPWMKAAEITDATIAALQSGDFRSLRINYANGDMVGHTGHREAAITAMQVVDLQVARLLPVLAKLGGAAIITADHGNADEMYERDKKTRAFAQGKGGVFKARTSHTLNPVPVHLFAPGYDLKLRPEPAAGLANLAATNLELLGFSPPRDYEPSLLAL